MADPALIRGLALFAPLLTASVLWAFRKPDARQCTGALLATLWNMPPLLLLNLLAARAGWWNFHAEGGSFLGMPVDLYLGWALLWGAVPALAFHQISIFWVLALMLSLDLLLMPPAAPVVQLGGSWLLGEGVGLFVCLVPAQLLARWTARDEHLFARVALQMICFGGLGLGLVPAAILEGTGGSWAPLQERPFWITGFALQLLALPSIVAVTAVQEFAERGHGSPVPYDPPRRLVTSGVYAYVANPMQCGMALLMAGWGALLGSPWVAAASGMSLAYSMGVASWDEENVLKHRFGDAWVRYRRGVRKWWPRWRPYIEATAGLSPATLYVAEGCAMCAQLGRWFQAHRPTGLLIVAAEDHPSRDLLRLTYGSGGAGREEEGIAALARGLEHIHLGWAFVGWSMRLPGIRHFLQLLADALGGGPRLVKRRSASSESGGA